MSEKQKVMVEYTDTF